jgi:hypothetical protein
MHSVMQLLTPAILTGQTRCDTRFTLLKLGNRMRVLYLSLLRLETAVLLATYLLISLACISSVQGAQFVT